MEGPKVSRELFGGVLDFDAAGHYPGLELLNFIYCGASEPLPAEDTEIRIRRRTHDFGRRLVWDPDFANDPRRREVLLEDEDAEETLRDLLRCLQLDIPSGSTDPSWSRAHFFPYTPSLIHWDGRERSGKILAERRYLRGGGALAFRILRSDPDRGRLDRTRKGFEGLYSATTGSPLAMLADFLSDQSTNDAQPVLDEIEGSSEGNRDDFENVFRDGMANILGQDAATSVSKVRAVIGWTGFWLVLMQNRRSRERLKLPAKPVICDCGARSPQLRRASQRCLQDAMGYIHAAVEDVEDRLPKKQRDKIRSFFWATGAAVGFLNAWRGRKHFTLSIGALEMIVLANVPSNTEMSYERFVREVLFERLGIAVGRDAAEASGLVNSIDASIFEENEAQLALQMIAAGLVTQYSDATRMVSLRRDT